MDPLEPRWGPEHVADADELQKYVFLLLCEGPLTLEGLAAAVDDESLPAAKANELATLLDCWGVCQAVLVHLSLL